jgi:transposase
VGDAQAALNTSSFKVIEDVRLKYACPRCHQGVALAEVPLSALEKRCHGPALLAEIIVRKYGDHLPLNRQVAIFARMGQRISKSSMCDDIEALAREFVPIVREMRLQVLEHPVVQCDETGILVCDRAAPGGSRKGYIRVYRGPIGAAVFEYTPTKEGHWAQEFLGDFAGYLQADAASSFDVLFVSGRITEVGCNAHARRKFFDIQEYAPSEAHTALLFYKHLAAIEKQATLSGASPEERRALRQERSRPLVEAYYKWLEESVPQQLPSSPLRKAMNYALNHRVAHTRFLEDGHLQVTNNDAERALRQVAVGRKAWEFAGSEEGARRAATLYSLVQSCKELKVDPAEYLRDVLMRLGTTPASRIRDLTPIDWKAAREGARASPPSDGEVPSEVPTSASSADTSP